MIIAKQKENVNVMAPRRMHFVVFTLFPKLDMRIYSGSTINVIFLTFIHGDGANRSLSALLSVTAVCVCDSSACAGHAQPRPLVDLAPALIYSHRRQVVLVW